MKTCQLFYKIVMPLLLLAGLSISNPALASDISTQQESDSYRVYLGVIPASVLKRQPQLVDGDRTLHGGIGKQSSGSQHVMVAIYRKTDNSRVKDATVIAEVAPDTLIKRDKQVKPLEKMLTSGAVTYGNFFRIPNSGEYRIKTEIYEPNRNGAETVTFDYEFRIE